VSDRPRIGIITFPGSLDDRDAARAVRAADAEAVPLWHADSTLHGVDAVVLPGGFSYGDYLRGGAIARFAPVMTELLVAARAGLPVLGICNGFQVLCEAQLLPGALTTNSHLRFRYRPQRLSVDSTRTAWTGAYAAGSEIVVPLKHAEGRYVADPATVERLRGEGRVVLRYIGADPNGSVDAIAGISNETGTVVGMMPHPEHAIDPLTGPSADGLGFFTSVVRSLAGAAA
jgi:phosphoribosylformylglycinamidine synthase subunit PurQ / glutaminase